MSQVRKFQEGGAATEPVKRKVPGADPVVIEQTPVTEEVATPKSYIIIDGEKFENTEEERQRLRNYFAKVSEGRGGSQTLSQIVEIAEKAAREGGNLTYDTPSNLFSYVDPEGTDQFIDWKNLNDRQDNRLQKQRSWLGKLFDATFNNKIQRSAEDISKLAGYRNFRKGNMPAPALAAANTPNLPGIDYGGWWEYLTDENGQFVKDENGNLKYNYDSAQNAKLQTQIQRALAAMGMTPEEAAKHFTWGKNWNKDGHDYSTDLRAIYSADPEGYKTRLQTTLDNVVAGRKMTPEDLAILKAYGIVPAEPKLTEEQQKAKEAADILAKWTNAGYGNIFEKGKDWFDIGDDNVLTLNDAGVEALAEAKLSKNGGYELNDSWLNYLRGDNIDATPYEWLNGYTLYNGRLYKTSSAADENSALAKIYRSSGYYDKNTQNLYADAQKIINSFWGNPYEWLGYDANYYSDFLWDPEANNGQGGERGYKYRSENGRYTGLQPGQQLVSYYTPKAKRDASGFVTDDSILYAITDSRGRVITKDITKEKLAQMGITPARRTNGSSIEYGDAENVGFSQYELKASPDVRINQHYLTSYGANNEYGVYRNPRKKPNLNDPSSLDVYFDPKFGGGFTIPPTLSSLIFRETRSGGTFMDVIISNPKLLEKFQTILEEFSRTRGANSLWRDMGVGRATFKNLLSPLGFNEQEIESAFTEWMKMLEDPNRMSKYVVSKPADQSQQVQSQKQGGTIRKYAPGGGFGKASKERGTQGRGTSNVTDPRKSTEVGFNSGFKWSNLTKADKLDLAGLALDLGAIAAGTVPLAGGVVGLGGTAAGLWADIERDGFQWRDLGNAGISAAGDIVSLLPGAGSGVQAAKLVTKIKKVAKPAMQLLSMYGAVSSIPLLEKLLSDGHLTAQEWRQFAAGLAGSINSAKAGRPFSKSTKLGDTYNTISINGKTKNIDLGEGLTIKPRAGVTDAPDITLTQAQIDEINALTDPLQRTIRAKNYAWESYKKNWDPANGPVGKRSDALAKYDFSSYYKNASNSIVANTGDTYVIKHRKNSDLDITLSKDEINRINSAADPNAEFKSVLDTKLHSDPKYAKYLNPKTGKASFGKDYNKVKNFSDVMTPGKYEFFDLHTNGRLTGKKADSDIDLEDADIKKIMAKKDPGEQADEFIKIVQEKSGNSSLDSMDKIKDEYDGIEQFFTKKRGSFEWRHPIESTKKKDTFTLNPTKSTIYRPVHGNGWRGGFGFRDWWNGTGESWAPFGSYKRRNILDPSRDLIISTQNGNLRANIKSQKGTNWRSAYLKTFVNPEGFTAMHLGNANPYEDDRSWRPHFAQWSYNANTPVWGYIPDDSPESETSFVDENGQRVDWLKQGGEITKLQSGGHFFENIGEKIGTATSKIDPASLAEFSKYLINISNSNKMAKIAKKPFENVPMKIATRYTVPTFSDNGLLNAGNETIKEIYNRQPANYTSDAMLNNFVRKANQEKATEYQNKLNTQFSAMVGQHNQKMWEIENRNTENAINTANENNQQRWKAELQKSNIDQATLAANNTSTTNLITNKVLELTKQKEKADAAKKSMLSTYQRSALQKALSEDGDYMDVMQQWEAYQTAHPTATMTDWFNGEGSANYAKYSRAMTNAQNKVGLDVMQIGLGDDFGPYKRRVDDFYNTIYGQARDTNMIPSAKQGGKTSDYKAYRDVREQLWIDNNKAVRQAINQLSKQSQQILLKMLK